MTQNSTPGYPRTASILALAGGVLILLGGVLFTAVSVFVLPNLSYINVTAPPQLQPSSVAGIVSGFVGVMGLFGLASGAIVLFSAVMLLSGSSQRRTWGALILVFSITSFLGMGGFVIGAILGIVGGALALSWKAPVQ